MGLLDILNGMQNGPRGQRQPVPSGSSSGGGMSPMMMALLGLLAYKAVKGGGLGNILGGGQSGGGVRPTSLPGGSVNADSGGGLGDLLGGLGGLLGGGRPGSSLGGAPSTTGGLGDLLGGLLGGASGSTAAGNALGGGLNNLIRDLQNSGQARVADSWVGTGPNQQIAPDDLASALGADTIDALSAQTGMRREDLLAGLSQQLPDMVDQLTPDGRLPTEEETSRWV